ncbi:MAG TPA: hypothetical protein VH161_02310, partial [Candidatus Acidoferrales bacterium]|nr:hypothetical protein [Candidatus Acidoferrales bacterium]
MNPALDSKVHAPVRPEASWVSVLELGAKEVFQIMLQSELTSLPNVQDLKVSGDVTAMVGMAGAVCGVLSIRCNSRT